MKKVPAKSEAGLRKGFWIVFQRTDKPIVLWLSAVSGKQIIYVANKKVSEVRSFRSLTQHHFQCGKEEYTIRVESESVFSEATFYSLLQDSVVIDEQSSYVQPSLDHYLWRISFWLPLAALSIASRYIYIPIPIIIGIPVLTALFEILGLYDKALARSLNRERC